MWSYDELKQGRDKAKTAGDTAAVEQFQKELESTPQYYDEWLGNAEAANDLGAVTEIAPKYFEKKGSYKGKDLVEDPVFQRYSRKLYEATQHGKFQGDDKAAGEFGLKFMRGMDSSDWRLADQLTRWSTGLIKDEEAAALQVLSAGYGPAEWSLEGVGAHVWNTLMSPSTYLGVGVGGAAAKQGGKHAIKGLTRRLVKGGVGKAARELAETSAKELAEQGVRTGAQRALRGGLVGAAEGAAFAGAHNLGQQSFTPDEVDPLEVVTTAALGGAVGGAAGALTGKLLSRDGQSIKAVRELVQGADGVPQGAAARVMKGVLQEFDESGQFLAKAKTDLPGAYQAFMDQRGKLTPKEMFSVFEHSIRESLRDSRYLYDETLAIGKRHGFGERLKKEMMDAMKLARREGVSPDDVRLDLASHPAWKKMPQEAKDRVLGNIKALQRATNEASDISDYAHKLMGKKGSIDKMVTHPNVTSALERFPRGYALAETLEKGMGMWRSHQVPRHFVQDMRRAATMDAATAPGPVSRAKVRALTQARDTADLVPLRAQESAINVDTGAWKAPKAPTSVRARAQAKARRQLENVAIQDKKLMDAAKVAGPAKTTDHGGIVGEMAVRRRINKPQALEELKEMRAEALEAMDTAREALNRAQVAREAPEVLKPLKDQLREAQKWNRYVSRFENHYRNNVNTGAALTGDKASSQKLYYRIGDILEERLAAKRKLMSDKAMYQYLRRDGMTDSQIATNYGKDFVAKAKNELKDEKVRKAATKKVKLKMKQDKEAYAQAQRAAAAKRLVESDYE